MIKDSIQVSPLKKDIFDALWDFFSSAKMAIWLLGISAVSILVGTVVEQGKPMDQYVNTYGPTLANIMQALHVFDLYHSWWFEFVMALICLNLFLSNFNRAEKIVKKYYSPPVKMDIAYFSDARAKTTQTSRGTKEEACLKLENALFRLKYRFQKEGNGDSDFYYADRGKLALWGSFVAHIGLLLLFAGVVYGHFPGQGFDRTVALMPGGAYYVPEAHFTFTLKNFEAKWNDQRLPVLYRSTLDVLDDNGKSFISYVEVNVPLVYRGVKVYQATYGPGIIFGHYLDRQGKTHKFQVNYSEDQMMMFPVDPGNGKQWIGLIRNFVPDFVVGPNGEVGSYSKEPVNPGLYVIVLTDVSKMPPKPENKKIAGWITRDRTASFDGVKFYLDKLSLFSGFELKRDLGVPLIFVSFVVIILGICLTFYFQHKVIRARVSSEGDKVRVVAVASRRDREQEYDKEFEIIKEAFQNR